MNNILVCIDFDKNASALIDKSAEIAAKFGSKVWIIHVADPGLGMMTSGSDVQEIRHMRADQLRQEHVFLQQLSDSLTARGISSDALLIRGDTTDSIIAQAKKLDADLIVIGYNEHTFMYRLFQRDTSVNVIRKAGIPVLIIPIDPILGQFLH